jgi:pimeloyl-ACP methyl ester carboxylesterase
VKDKEDEMEERKTKGIGYITGTWPLNPQKSTIVFIHGAGGSSKFWQGQVAALTARVNTVAVDLPGHGRSDGPGCDDIRDYTRAVADFLTGIAAPPVILCGFSMGGAVALQLMTDCPERVKAGILSNTGAALKVAPLIFETIDNDYSGFVDMICKFAASKKTDPELMKPFRQDLAGCQPKITRGDFQACNQFDLTDRLPTIDIPILVVTASEDKLTPSAYGDLLVKRVRNASLVHIQDAGHIAPLEKPDEINAAIEKFIEKEAR